MKIYEVDDNMKQLTPLITFIKDVSGAKRGGNATKTGGNPKPACAEGGVGCDGDGDNNVGGDGSDGDGDGDGSDGSDDDSSNGDIPCAKEIIDF